MEFEPIDLGQVIKRVLDERHRLVDAVCWAAIADGRYGVLVDVDGVRMSADVPPLTIAYGPDPYGVPDRPWTAVFTPPDATSGVPSDHGREDGGGERPDPGVLQG